ncbi:MAG: helix-turn-helix domain-containing protein [Bacilli bacterium]|nr:helix-turn-helix domain-containing protein [Bacilli bacterium]
MHLNKMRISQAKVFFENSDLTIQEIAHKVGYKNISTFTEAFKRVMGMTPNYYRKKFM